MARIEKTVFICYRRTNVWLALAVWQNLTHSGYDVFFDYKGIASGDFERIILENIRARAHFLVLLTPSALDRVGEPDDWLRREIEAAIESRRNIVPLTLDGFDFGAPSIAGHFTGSLEPLRHYNALHVPPDYFEEAMQRLRDRHLNVALDAVLQPVSTAAKNAVKVEQSAAKAAPAVQASDLSAEKWAERGYQATDVDEMIRCYTEAIRLKADYALAYNNRGAAHREKGDVDAALQDYEAAIRLKPDYPDAYLNRGAERRARGDVDGALRDYGEAMRLKPDDATAYFNRGIAREAKGDVDGAIQDYGDAIRLKPDFASAYFNRGITRKAKGDVDGAIQDYGDAIRLKPNYANAYYNRAGLWKKRGASVAAIADFRKYLDLGGGKRDGDQAAVEGFIRDLET